MAGQATAHRHPPVSLSDPDRQGDHAHSQVDEKLVECPPRYWAPVRREPAILGTKSGRQPQLDNTVRWVSAAIVDAEKKFRRVHGWREITTLVSALGDLEAKEEASTERVA